MKKKKLSDLVESLTKFLQWQDEYDLVRSHLKEGDLAGELMKTLGIPASDVRTLIGGSNSPIFDRANREILARRQLMGELYDQIRELQVLLRVAVSGELLRAVVTGDMVSDITGRINRALGDSQ